MRKGARNDLVQVTKMIQEGCSLRDIYNAGLGYQACRHAERLMSVMEAPRPNVQVQVNWIYGEPGEGKTRIPWEYTCKHLGGIKIANLVYYQMYDRHRYIVVDDIRPTNECCGTYANLLHFLDPYDHILNVKGTSRQLCATHIFITTPYTPEQFSLAFNATENPFQLRRRILNVFFLPTMREQLKKYCADVIKDAGQVPCQGLSPSQPWLSQTPDDLPGIHP